MTICPPDIQQRVIAYLHERFGLDPSLWEPYRFYYSSRSRIHLGPHHTIANPTPDSAGCLIARVQRTVKPSSALLQLFGHHVTREIVDLTKDQTRRYISGESITVDPAQTTTCRLGFVMLRYDNMPLACGLLRDHNLIENQLPRASWCHVDSL